MTGFKTTWITECLRHFWGRRLSFTGAAGFLVTHKQSVIDETVYVFSVLTSLRNALIYSALSILNKIMILFLSLIKTRGWKVTCTLQPGARDHNLICNGSM